MGIDQELGGVEPEAAVGIVGAVRAQPVARARADPGHRRRKDPLRAALERDAVEFGLAARVEEAEPELRRPAGPDGEARASGDRRRTERRCGGCGHEVQVITSGCVRPVRARMPASASAAAITSASASAVARPWRAGSGSKRSR